MLKVNLMNYFFGINNSIFKSELQIPLFQNKNFKKSNCLFFRPTIFSYKGKYLDVHHS